MDWSGLWQSLCEYVTTPEYQGAMATGSVLTTALGFVWRRLRRGKADAERPVTPVTPVVMPVYIRTHDGTEVRVG